MLVGLLFLFLFISQQECAEVINGVCLDCQSKILVPAGGSSTAAPMIRQLAFSFGLVENSIQVNYVSQSMGTAMERLQNPCRKNYELDFAALDFSLSAWKSENPLESNDLVAIPLVADAIIVTFNLPGYSMDSDPALVLSRELLYDIHYGNVTMWDDPQILQLNPLLVDKLPHANVTLILRNDPTGAAEVVMQIFSNLDSTITGRYTKYPTELFNYPNRLVTTGSYGVIASIMTIPYSLGVVAQAYSDEAGLPVAKLRNRDGYIVEAGNDMGVHDAVDVAMQALLTEVQHDDEEMLHNMDIDELNPIDQPGNTSYPLSSIVHFVYHTEIEANCDARIAMAKFINWVLTAEDALTQIVGYSGFTPLPQNLIPQVLAKIASLSCNGQKLLELTFVDFGNNSLTQTVIIFATVLIFISLAILSTLSWKRNNRITRAAGLAFAFFFLLGCIFNYISAIFFAEIPVNSHICQARYSFVCLGYALILGAMFAKCWEISRIFARAEAGDISPFKELPWWMFCRAFFGVVFFEALFLFIWLIVDPPQTMIMITDTVNLLAIHDCRVNYPSIWYGLHFTYFAVVLIWGAYLAYETRDIWQKYNYPNESRSILLSIYNLAFCAVILVPLVTVLGASPSVLFFLIAVAIIFPTTFSLVVVHGPKMAAFLASSVRGSKTSKGSADKDRERSAPKSPNVALHHHLAAPEISHTVRLLKTLEEGKDKSKDKDKEKDGSVLTEEVELTSSGHGTHLAGLDESSAKPKERDGVSLVPSLAPTWKILTPSVSAKPHPRTPQQVGDHDDHEIEESPALTSSRNPLFEEPTPQSL